MQIISPKFLENCERKRNKVLKELFKDEDIFNLVMNHRDVNFVQACEWIADEVFDIELPLASDSEVKLMQMAAKEMIEKSKKS